MQKFQIMLVILVVGGFIALGIYQEYHTDPVAHAMSYGLHEGGANNYAKACEGLRYSQWPDVEEWSAENPYDVSEETREGCTAVGIVAANAIRKQEEEARADWMAEVAEIRDRVARGDSFSPEEQSFWAEEIAEAEMSVALERGRQAAEEEAANWPPPGYEPPDTTGP